jgi:hypothetical protein
MLVDRVAVVHGPAALAVSRVLQLPEVQAALLASPPWLRTPELATAVAAIHQAAAAYEADLRRSEAKPAETARRSTRARSGVGVERAWSVGRTARHLQVSDRRVQQLAAAGRLGAELVGGRWLIDPTSVRRFAQVREGAAA